MIPTTPLQWFLLLAGAYFLLFLLANAIVRRKYCGSQLRELCFSPDSQTLYGAGKNFLKGEEPHDWVWAWDTATGCLLWRSKVEAHISTFALAPDGASLLIAGFPGAMVWDTATGQPRFALDDERYNGMADHVYFTPDAQRILGCCKEGIPVWDSQIGERLDFWPIPKDKTGWPYALQFSADGTKVLIQAGGWSNGETGERGDAFTQLWNADTGEVIQDFPTSWYSFAALSPDGKTGVTTSARSLPEDAKGNVYAIYRAYLYTIVGEKLLQSPEFPLYFRPKSLAFQEDGNVLVKGEYSRVREFTRPQAFLWNTQTNQITEQPVDASGVLSPNRRLRAIANYGGYKHRPPLGAIYDADTGEKLCDLKGLAGR